MRYCNIRQCAQRNHLGYTFEVVGRWPQAVGDKCARFGGYIKNQVGTLQISNENIWLRVEQFQQPENDAMF